MKPTIITRSIPAGGTETTTVRFYDYPRRRHSNLGPWYAIGEDERVWTKADGSVENYKSEFGFSLTFSNPPYEPLLRRAVTDGIFRAMSQLGASSPNEFDYDDPVGPCDHAVTCRFCRNEDGSDK